ncbi:FAD:protein FMN transferase [Colwellia psychrerythraea]|uniref:FAD:protein FMN transferase n=1 Tax=Colwellia psychrerythraea TaxID=28229 RepID=A0A099KYY4_COLPS|nr:FAD:protein FMN transferase [Colwellia psychrerythraea]KGJ94858.1 ApbE family lipoprotein [Colwellia psychrerythraea]
MISHSNTKLKKYSHQFNCMTTPCEVQLFAADAKAAGKVARLIEKNTRRLEKKYNFFSDDSLIGKINNREQATVNIDKETHQVLSLVQTLSATTQGSFDITVGTLKQCAKQTTVAKIEACRAKLTPFIGADKWRLTENSLHFSNEYVKLDLGGVIKEFAVDQAGAIAKNENMAALINFGGDIYVNGNKPDGSPFNVAIKNPKNPQENIAILQLSNQGLTTSAHYERSTLVEGKSYSHIINSKSSNSKSSNASSSNTNEKKKHNDKASNTSAILSATVISHSVLTSGIYSTSLMVNSNLIIEGDINVVMIDEELRLHQNIF